jgi:arsenate reductase (thioredoxin)
MNKNQNPEKIVLFICEHGSAKSVVAAAHFNKIAQTQNLNARAISRGTNPDDEIPPAIIEGLKAEGLKAEAPKPNPLLKEDLAGAFKVVIFCDLPPGFDKTAQVNNWNDVPPISEDYAKSRDVMVRRIGRLFDEFKLDRTNR